MNDRTKHQLESLRTLVLKHEMLIDTWTQRLDDISPLNDMSNDGPSAFYRAQLEFLILNAECQKADKENQLKNLEEYAEMQITPINLDPVYPVRLTPPLTAEQIAEATGKPYKPIRVNAIDASPFHVPEYAYARIPYHFTIDPRDVKETRGYLRRTPQYGNENNGLILVVIYQGEEGKLQQEVLVDPDTGHEWDWTDTPESDWALVVTVPGAANLLPLSCYPDAVVHTRS
jgi:hypothetical protein